LVIASFTGSYLYLTKSPGQHHINPFKAVRAAINIKYAYNTIALAQTKVTVEVHKKPACPDLVQKPFLPY
jgi:hypothetical protein